MSYILHVLEGLYFIFMLPIEAIRRLLRDNQGSGSILGVLLMVAIVVALGAILAVMLWSYGDFTSLQETSKSVYQLP